MKRLFLLLPALVLSFLANAAVININTSTDDALRVALGSANDGDEIVMAAGTYVESPSNYIAFSGKNVIVRAAEGANVIVKPHVPITISAGARAEIRGIKIDASELCSVNSYSHLIYSSDGADNNRLILDGCEVYGYTEGKAIVACRSSQKLDSLIINNCKFYNHTTRSCAFVENSANIAMIVTNSSFFNIATGSADFSAGILDSRSSIGKVVIDHCTFYNCYAKNTDYGAVKVPTTTDAHVSNCIFMMSDSYSGGRAVYNTSGEVKNCLTYNYTKDDSPAHGIHSGPTRTDNKEGDPLFTDAASGDFTFANNWVTMSISPACGASTDGTDLGDPRWYTDPVLPSTDFASGYQFVGAKAQISGNLWYDGVKECLYYNDKSENGVATWKINATRACIVQATLNMNAETTTGHKFKVEVLDAEGNSVAETAEPSSKSDAGDIVLPDQITLPAAGNYTIKLYNLTGWSSAMIDGVTLAYVGGDVQNMPGTTDIDDAWFSSNGTRADSKITFPNGKHDVGWVKWNVAFASAGNYNVTVNVNNTAGHNFTVALYRSESDESPISVGEGGSQYSSGTPNAIALGAMEVPAGNYIMKVTDAVAWSDAELLSVTFAYAGGGVIDFGKSTVGSLLANADAIVSDDWSIEGGKITHAESKALTGWAKWNVDCADYGNYNVTVNISSDNGHLVRVEIFENEAESAIYTLDETSSTQWNTGNQAIDLGNIVLDDREYVVKVSNTQASSHVQIASIVITYLNGARATLPATLDADDVMFSTKAYADGGEIYFSPNPGSQNVYGEWAKWNVKAAAAGTFLFTMDVTSSNSQTYKITILDGETEIDSYEKHPSSGDQTIKHYFNLAAGNYTVKLENTYSWSNGHVVSLVVTQPSLLTIDETAESNSVIHDNYRNGNHDIQIIRTVTSGMYNTICLPFDVSETEFKATFGSDVTLLEMSTASLSGDELTLEFDDVTSIERGKPYLIKTTKTVSNPVFTDVEIKEETGQATSDDGADFIGSFIKTTIDASEYNLFLGANDKLYFSNNDVTLKGMRAYFQIKDNGSGAPVRKARIVEQHKVVTELELIDGEWQDIKSANGTIKTIENGQFILIRDGKRYNVMGIRF